MLTDGRSGSTLLVDELGRRWDSIRAEREIFLPIYREKFEHFEDVVTDTYINDTGHPIVGCKVLRDQVSRDQLDALLHLEGMQVIILRRRNELRRQVSFQIATRTSVWSDTGRLNPAATHRVGDRSISLDERSFYRDLQATNQWFRTCEQASKGLSRINVWYEDLTADLDSELRRIATFLGAGEPDREDPPRLRKQNPESLRTLITNFDEISDFLHDVGLGATLTEERGSATPPAPTHPPASWQPCWPTKAQQVLLRAALAPATSFESRWVEWVRWRDSHVGTEYLADMYPTLHHRLRRSHGASPDIPDYRVEAMRNTALKIRLSESLESTLDGLSTDGIGSILLGPTAILAMCTDREGDGFRTLTMNGLDLTPATGDLDSVVSSLLGLGWRPTATTRAEVAVVSLRREDLELRLHRAMAPDSALESDLRSGLRAAGRFGPRTQMPAAAELLVGIILDGLFERPSGSIGWILDVHSLVSGDLVDPDWDRFVELTAIHQLGAPVRAAVHLLAELCEDLLPATVIERIENIAISDEQRRNFEHAMRQP